MRPQIQNTCEHRYTWREEKTRDHFLPWRSCMFCGATIMPWVGKSFGRADPSLLTYELATKICADVRAGVFAWVAAAKYGIDVSTYHDWRNETAEEFRVFRRMIDTAAAEARADAEMVMKATDPRTWLTKGPGKKHSRHLDGDEDGWGEETKKVEMSGQVNHAHGHMHVFQREALEGLSTDELRILKKLLAQPGESEPDGLDSGGTELAGLLSDGLADSGTGDAID